MVPREEKPLQCFKFVTSRRMTKHVVLATLAAVAFLVAIGSSTARAETFGQIGEAWGEPGSGPGQFFDPAMFGVDPSDGSVYAGDLTSDLLHYRIQKFSSTGEFEASVEIPRWFNNNKAEEKIIGLHGIAVDHEKGLAYMIEGCRVATGLTNCRVSGGRGFNARRILVFESAPEGSRLVPSSPASISLPEGTEELYNPQSIAVDPSTHDLVILAESAAGHLVVQRVSSSGVLGAHYEDTADVLKPGEGNASSVVVGPDGTTYTVTGGKKPGAQFTRAWELPKNLSEVKKVPGFAEAAEAEGWLFAQSGIATTAFGGPQIAISPPGTTLYWKEAISSSGTDAGDILVRGYSLISKATAVLYGGGESRCKVTTSGAGVATTGEDVLVFDYGPEGKAPPYGDRILKFGPGGSGCPTPVSKFSVNGQESDGVMVGKGEVVTFDATASELSEGEPRELIWDFGDGQRQTVKCPLEPSGGCEVQAPPTVTHEYSGGGEFTVTLEIKLITPTFGDPLPAQHTLRVRDPMELSVFKSGTGSGTVTSSPAGIDCGSVCAAAFESGTAVALTPSAESGSEFAGWSGACTGTGACQVTMSEAKSVTARFDSGGPPPSHFPLTVLTTGAGSGSVSSTPLGIDCGASCAAEFEAGATVTLTPTVGAGAKFAGWSGACTGTGGCQVTMSEAKTVGAAFDVGSGDAMLTVSKAGSGSGSVKSAQSGINCGAVCAGEFKLGQTVTLFPVAATGSKFERWGGDCADAGTALTCKVAMSDNRTVSASFDAIPAAPASQGGGGSAAAGAAGSGGPGLSGGKAKPTARQKALARCMGMKKGKARARCIKSARGIGKKARHGKRRGHGGRH
jgi:hypothetical protein